MPSDRLYEMLAEVEAQPSDARQVLEAALGAAKNIGQGYLASKDIQEKLRKQRMAQMTIRDLFPSGVPETMGEYSGAPLEAALATLPLTKDKMTRDDMVALMSVYNPEAAMKLALGSQNDLPPQRSDMASLGEDTGSLPPSSSPPITAPSGMTKSGLAMTAKALAQKKAQAELAKRQKERIDAQENRQKERIDAVNSRIVGQQKVQYEKAAASIRGTEIQTDDLFKLYDEIEKEGKVGQALGLRGRLYEAPRAALTRGNAPGTNKIYAFQQLADGLIARLRSFTGDVGVMTEQDAVRMRGLLPQIGENPDVSRRKLGQIKRLLDVSKSGNIFQVDALLREFGIKTQDAPWDLQQRSTESQYDQTIMDEPSEMDGIYSEAGL